MNIRSICNTINRVIDSARNALSPIPALLLVCSAIKRPGLSAMVVASNIISRQYEAGAPSGPLPDGSRSISEAMERIRVEEMIKAIKSDMEVEVGIPIGGIQITGTGSNAGGPVTITGFNINFPKGTGIGR